MKALKPIIVLGVLLTALGVGFALLDNRAAQTITISEAKAAPIMDLSGKVAVFAKISNSGRPDRLLSVSSPVATGAALNAPSGALAIPANSTPTLSADGAFIELVGVKGDRGDGQLIPVTLTFEAAGPQSVQARLIAPRKTGPAAAMGLFGIGDICRVGDGEPAPALALSATQTASGWQIDIQAKDFEFRKDLIDGLHIPGTGHGHLYVNGLKLGRVYDSTAQIGALPPGRHAIQITLNTNDHRAYVVGNDPVRTTVFVDVSP